MFIIKTGSTTFAAMNNTTFESLITAVNAIEETFSERFEVSIFRDTIKTEIVITPDRGVYVYKSIAYFGTAVFNIVEAG